MPLQLLPVLGNSWSVEVDSAKLLKLLYSALNLQRETLEMVGRRRGQGALRTELASHLHCDSGKFHYVIKVKRFLARIVLSDNLHSHSCHLSC